MKKYNEYMDSITVSPAQNSYIMKQAMQKAQAKPPKRRVITRLTGIAATAAVVALCVLMVPILLNNRSGLVPGGAGNGLTADIGYTCPDYNGINGSSDQEYPGNGECDIVVPGDLADGNLPSRSLYALTLNELEQYPSPGRVFTGDLFWHEATPEQLQATLPYLGFPVSAVAEYHAEGNLLLVRASKISSPQYSDTMIEQVVIQIAPREIGTGFMYDFEPSTSYVHGVAVVAAVLYNHINGGNLYIATFMLGDIGYSVRVFEDIHEDNGLDRLTEIVNTIIQHSPADLSVFADPVIPELVNEVLSLDEARQDSTFGAFLPVGAAPGFVFDSSRRIINQTANSLHANWHRYPSFDSIMWWVSRPTQHDLARVVSVHDREKFDLELYPIPWMDSVPDELINYVSNPVFLAEELTFEIVQARVIRSLEPGYVGVSIRFSILYDDVIVHIDTQGVTPEQLWDMLPVR